MLKNKIENILNELKNNKVKSLEINQQGIKSSVGFQSFLDDNKIYTYENLKLTINNDLKLNGIKSQYLKLVKSFNEIDEQQFDYFRFNDKKEKIDCLKNIETILLWLDNMNKTELVDFLEKNNLIKYELN